MVLEGILAQRLLPRSEGKGRVLALEILIPSPAIRNLIREDKIHQMYSMMQTGQAQYGMQTMNQALTDLVAQGVISSELAMGLTTLPDELVKLLERGRDRPGSMSLARLRPRM
jgi:twitching motility protein PilT